MSFKTRRIREVKPRRSWFVVKKVLATVHSGLCKAGLTITGLFARTKSRDDKPAKTGKQKEVREPSWVQRTLKRAVVVCIAAGIVLAIFVGIAKALVALNVLNVSTILNSTAVDLPKDANGFTNFLLLGRGDDDHDGIDLTDTIMVLSLDPTTSHSAVLLSIPRDLYVLDRSESGMGRSRVNELYRDYKNSLVREKGWTKPQASSGAIHELMDVLGKHLGLTLHHTAIVNFSGFAEAVDAVGGLDIDVPYDIEDTEYPGPNYTYETFSIKAGPAHLDGATALKYARSRHTTSDFGRSARQQQLIGALAEKGKALGLLSSPGKLLSLYKILSENVETTMDMNELLGAARLAQSVDRDNVVSMQLSDRNGLYGTVPEPGGLLYPPPRVEFGGASVLLPVSIPEFPVTWKQIQAFVSLLVRERWLYLDPRDLVLLNASGRTGLASVLSAEMTRYGLQVRSTGNEPTGKKLTTSSVLYRTDADRPTAVFLASLLRLPSPILAPSDFPVDSLGSVTILLGKDYTYSPFQDLLPASP